MRIDTDRKRLDLVDCAEFFAVDADLIVLGSQERQGPTSWLGSTTDGVMHRAACDVLTVR